MNTENKLFSISELADEFGLTTRTLRYYEEVGLITPLRPSGNGQRYYDRRQRARLKLILRGKRFGMSLEEIREMIELYDVDPTQRVQLKRTIELGDKRIAEIDSMISELEQIKAEMVEFKERFTKMLQNRDDGGEETKENG